MEEAWESGLIWCLKSELQKVVDWNSIERDDYLMAMGKSPIKDVEMATT